MRYVTRGTTVTLVLCLGLMLMMAASLFPNSAIQRSIGRFSRYVLVPLGLTQSWSMFANAQTGMQAIRFTFIYPGATIVRVNSPYTQGASFPRSLYTNLHQSMASRVDSEMVGKVLQGMCRDQKTKGLRAIQFEIATAPLPTLASPDAVSDPFTITPNYQVARNQVC